MKQAPLMVEDTMETPRVEVPEDELTSPPLPHVGGGVTLGGLLGAQEVEFALPLDENGDRLDADHDEDAPIQFWMIDNILGLASPIKVTPRALVVVELCGELR